MTRELEKRGGATSLDSQPFENEKREFCLGRNLCWQIPSKRNYASALGVKGVATRSTDMDRGLPPVQSDLPYKEHLK